MPTCANCGADAFYEYAPNPAFPIFYCAQHLPGFLIAQRNLGLVKKVEAPVVSTSTSKKKKSETPVEETPVVEEPVAEETPVVEEVTTEE